MGIDNFSNFFNKIWTQLDVNNDGSINNQDKTEMEAQNSENLSIYTKLENTLGNVNVSKNDYEEACEGVYDIDGVINNLKKKNVTNGAKQEMGLVSVTQVPTQEDNSNEENDYLLKQAKDFANGNFEILNQIDNPILFMENYKKISDGKTLYSRLLASFNEGKISKEEFLNYLDILGDKFEQYENEYNKDKTKKDYHFHNFKSEYKTIAERTKACLYRQEVMEGEYEKGLYNKNQILEVQKFLQEEYGIDISEDSIAQMYSYRQTKKFVTYDMENKCYTYNVDELRKACKNDKSLIENIKNRFCSYNTLSAIEMQAKNIETEYERYNFDIHNSKIGDLVLHTENMIKEAETNITIEKNNDKIFLKDNATGQERTIDLNVLTADLNDDAKHKVLSSIEEMNNLSLWELAAEVNKSLRNDALPDSAGQYFIEDDHIGVNERTDSYALTHEMIHAMMATVIDGKNTDNYNDPLYQKFIETYNEEQAEHKRKGVIHTKAVGYTYCATDIHEFEAEAGCLYLTGKSNSAFSIAEHYPKSYRIFVELIEKIRNQDNGRTISE